MRTDQTNDSVDFLPERIRARRRRNVRILREAYIVVGCALLLVMLGYLRQGGIREARAELESANRRPETPWRSSRPL